MLGEILKAAREKKHLTVIDMENRTSIKRAYVTAIEEENWEALPNAVYVKGFIRNLANILDIESDSLVKEFNDVLSGEKFERTESVVANYEPQNTLIASSEDLHTEQENKLPATQTENMTQSQNDFEPQLTNQPHLIEQPKNDEKIQDNAETIGTIETIDAIETVETIENVEIVETKTNVEFKDNIELKDDAVSEDSIDFKDNAASQHSVVMTLSEKIKNERKRDRVKALIFLVLIVVVGFGSFNFINDALSSVSPQEEFKQEVKAEDAAAGSKPQAETLQKNAQSNGKKAEDTAKDAKGEAAKSDTNKAQNDASAKNGVELVVKFKENCWIKVTVDGKVAFENIAAKGSTGTWKGKEKISVSVKDAGILEINHNGKNLGVMGTKGKAAEKVFTK